MPFFLEHFKYESKEYNTALCLLNDLDRHPLYHDNTCMEAGEGVEGVPVDNVGRGFGEGDLRIKGFEFLLCVRFVNVI